MGKKEKKEKAAGAAAADAAEQMDVDEKPKPKLPKHLQTHHDYVTCGTDLNYNVNTVTSANVYRALGVDNSWDLKAFKRDFAIHINWIKDMTMEFDMVGCDPAIANALRRILIAEVPTVALEHVFVVNNTSIIQDEVLAHRLGLVPLLVEPNLLEAKTAEEAPSEKNTLVFKLNVMCRRGPNSTIENDKVLSGQLQWLPQGSEMPEETTCRFAAGQSHMFASAASAPRPVHDEILLAKLRPGQCIVLEAHAIKGVGREHAKWSPVATAWYRLLPYVEMLKDDVSADSPVGKALIGACPDLFTADAKTGFIKVGEARGQEMHLEKLRRLLEDEEVSEAVAYRKKKDHFIFTIESTGIIPPQELLLRALDILEEKAQTLAAKI